MPTKKSVAFVANTSWSIYKFRLYLIKELIAAGFQVFVLAPRDKYSDRFDALDGVTFIELKKFRAKQISVTGEIQLYRELLGHYRRIQPAVIFHYTIKANIFGSLAASRAGCRSVSVITGLGYMFSGNPILQLAAKILYRAALRKNTEVWFLNGDDREVFTREGLVSPDKTFLLPGEGVDSEVFYPSPYEPKPGPVTFLLIGRVIKHKGIFEFIDAIQVLQSKGLDAQFQLLGFFDEGSPVAISREQVDRWVSQKKISYLGQTDDVRPFIAAADCIVLPSYREGMPLSLLEAASMCKALIASDTAGCREIVDPGVNGYLCMNKNGADLAKKMESYYRLPAEAKRRMGIEGRDRVLAHFTKEIVTRIYLDKLNSFG